MPQSWTRRSFIGSATALGAGLLQLPQIAPVVAQEPKKPRVAAVVTVLRFRSHAYNILENFFKPYLFRGQLVDPGMEVVSLYVDQVPDGDMSRDFSKRFQVPRFDSIAQTVCRGGTKLDVDAVLLIGEHGEYPHNELGQHMYPRKRFFDEIVAVVKQAGRPVPIFNDKHLSYRWDWALEIYHAAKQLRIPLLAGSSVPLAERRTMWELPANAEIIEAVSIHGGGLESYDFHALEVLQSMVESRRGGESGIARVELLADEQYDQAARKADWPSELIAAALAAEQKHDERRQSQPRPMNLTVKNEASAAPNVKSTQRHAIRLTYRDGFKATVVKSGSSSDRWNFACRIQGESDPRACMFFNGPWGNRCLFKALSHAIQHHFRTGNPPYPVERTLLVSGILEAAMRSHQQGGVPIDTPHLGISYAARDFNAFRENGASWKILTRETLQPVEFTPGDAR